MTFKEYTQTLERTVEVEYKLDPIIALTRAWSHRSENNGPRCVKRSGRDRRPSFERGSFFLEVISAYRLTMRIAFANNYTLFKLRADFSTLPNE